MPRNRSHLDRDGKRTAIIEAAATLFGEQGYEQTSMSAIAAKAAITKNTVYWYFADKDALLVAVIGRAVRVARQRWDAEPGADLATKLVHLTRVFDEISSLTTALHARLDASPAASAWHDRFHAASDAWLAEQIAGHAVARQRPATSASLTASTVRLWTYAIEGMVSHGLPADERAALCRQLVAQLDGAAPG